MLWIAGGVGITPFMAMWDGILQVAKANPGLGSTDVVLLFAGRDDDINVLTHFAARHGSHPKNVKLRVMAFQSIKGNVSAAQTARDDLRSAQFDNALGVEERRMGIDDIQSVANLKDREVFMCGPDAMMNWSETTLTELGIEEARRHRETFVF